MKENFIISVFQNESEAYKALSELKSARITDNYIISQANVVKKENGSLILADGFDFSGDYNDDTLKGGLIGTLIGILGGPLGVLLGSAAGMLIGRVIDAEDAADSTGMIVQVSNSIEEGKTALIILAQEEYETALTEKLGMYDVTTTRLDAAEVAAELDRAKEAEKQIAWEAWQKMHQEKTEKFRERVAGKREELKKWFDDLRSK